MVLWIIAFSLPGGIGAALVLVFPQRIHRNVVPDFVSYATGALLGAAFLGMIPAGLNSAPAGALLAAVLAGIATAAYFHLGH